MAAIILTAFVALGAAWFSHWLVVRRSAKIQRKDDARVLETVASIVNNAMSLIDTAKKQICDGQDDSIARYYEESYSAAAFRSAGEALREIQIAQMPDLEVVRPILDMRDLVLTAEEVIDDIGRHRDSPEGNRQNAIEKFRKLHRRATIHTSTVEGAVIRMRESG